MFGDSDHRIRDDTALGSIAVMKMISRVAAILALVGLLTQPVAWVCVSGDSLCCPDCAVMAGSPAHWTGSSCHMPGPSTASSARCQLSTQVLALSKVSKVDPDLAGDRLPGAEVQSGANARQARFSCQLFPHLALDRQSLLSVFRI
jgi:hypothetical protein